MKNIISLFLALCIAAHLASAQSSFRNLNFEQARIVPIGSQGLPLVVASNAIPGWAAYQGNTPLTEILYNTITLGTPIVSIHDTASQIFQPFQGNYSVGIQHSSGGPPTTAAIGQIGQVPLNALSVVFYASNYDRLQVTFAGTPIPFVQLGMGSGYSILGGDISTYAGQIGELRFTHIAQSGLELVELDNIQFSTQPVPEPSTLALLTLAGIAGWFWWKRKAR